jgi:hypothetical protein
MDRPASELSPEIRAVLDRLKLTPQHFLDFEKTGRADLLTPLREIEWQVTARPSPLWPFTSLWWINLDTLDRGLRSTLDPLGIGYCYMIRCRNQFVHFASSGWAQLPDDGQVPWLFHIPMNIASVSKFVTAIATVRLLRDLKLPPTAPIIHHLPQYWSFGPGVGAITFEDLMRHESGLGGSLTDSGPVTFAAAKDQVAIGSSGRGAGTYSYKNINFTLLRVLFATLTGAVGPRFRWPELFGISADTFWDFASISTYIQYVNDALFAAAMIDWRDFTAPENAARAYATPPAKPGWADGDTSAGAGASGWYLGAGELIRLLAEFRRSGSIMAQWRARKLMANRYGLDDPVNTKAGLVHYKGGRWGAGPQVHDSAIFVMPGDAELVAFTNSWDGTGPGHLGKIPQLIQDSVEFIW